MIIEGDTSDLRDSEVFDTREFHELLKFEFEGELVNLIFLGTQFRLLELVDSFTESWVEYSEALHLLLLYKWKEAGLSARFENVKTHLIITTATIDAFP